MHKLAQFFKKFLWYLIRPHKTLKNLKYYLIDHGVKPLVHDHRLNKITVKNSPHIFFLRNMDSVAGYNHHFINWVKEHFPKVAAHIRLTRITWTSIPLKHAALAVFWLQDPLKECDFPCYQKALRLQQKCAKLNIPIINPVETLSNSIKSRALPIINQCGIRTAKVVKISNPPLFDPEKSGLTYPFFIREDYLHGSSELMVNTADDLRSVNWSNFSDPIALEFINVQNSDGLFRKYRYFLMGDKGVQKHLIISKNWRVRFKDRADPKTVKNEELEYLNLSSDPNHDILNKARQALHFDTVAFDYSYDQKGRLVVWEPNPFPLLWETYYQDPSIAYYGPYFDKLYTKLLKFYLQKANMLDLMSQK